MAHKHKWFIEIYGVQFLMCACEEIRTVIIPEKQKQKVYIKPRKTKQFRALT